MVCVWSEEPKQKWNRWMNTRLSRVCISIFQFNVLLFPKPISGGKIKCVCNIYAHAILHTCPGLLSYLLLCFFFFCAAAVFPPFIFLVFADYYFLLLLQPGKYIVCVCVCVVKNRAEKSWEFLCILNNFSLYFFTLFLLLFGSCLDDR